MSRHGPCTARGIVSLRKKVDVYRRNTKSAVSIRNCPPSIRNCPPSKLQVAVAFMIATIAVASTHDSDNNGRVVIDSGTTPATSLTADPCWKSLAQNQNLPDRVDWHGGWSNYPKMMSAVKNQGTCGSCWSFAATAVLETRMAKMKYAKDSTNPPLVVDLNEQELQACIVRTYPASTTAAEKTYKDCNGGDAQKAFEYVTQNGLANRQFRKECKYQWSQKCHQTQNIVQLGCQYQLNNEQAVGWDCNNNLVFESGKPFNDILLGPGQTKHVWQTAADTCDERKDAREVHKEDFTGVCKHMDTTTPLTIDQLKQALQDGPVAVGMSFSETDLNSFRSWKKTDGIFSCGGSDPKCSSGHEVVVVGYGYNSGITCTITGYNCDYYWIVRNSWGTDWGQDGYFKLKMSTGNHWEECGIRTQARFPENAVA